jgi:hypothetical protein
MKSFFSALREQMFLPVGQSLDRQNEYFSAVSTNSVRDKICLL